ncbi:MAG: 3-isopropylmalate dehydratase [Candidatus Bathyarchaeia archaeon]
MESIIEGKVWKFGDNISTDLMMPGFSRGRGLERAKFCMYSNRPGWSDQVQKGDIIVGGKNFGCGSSRPAAINLQLLGISAVVAESIGRIFFRNSINIGLPAIIAPGITEIVDEGERIRIDLEKGEITNLNNGKTLHFDPMPEDSPPMQILKAGGILRLLEAEYKPKEKLTLVSSE